MEIISSLFDLLKSNWDKMVIIYLALHKLLVTLRDVLDKTPGTDDNKIEQLITLSGKLADYLIKGKRPA